MEYLIFVCVIKSTFFTGMNARLNIFGAYLAFLRSACANIP